MKDLVKIVTYRGKQYRIECHNDYDAYGVWIVLEEEKSCYYGCSVEIIRGWSQVYMVDDSILTEKLANKRIFNTDDNYLIEKVKELFKCYQHDLDRNEKERKQNKLFENWDGVIR